MDKATLKSIRLLVPGIIVLVCLLPCINFLNFKPITDKLPTGVIIILLTFLAQIIGGIYYAFDLRNLLWRPFVIKCQENIWTKLVSLQHHTSALHGSMDKPSKKQAMRVFYSIIDNDPSLKDQAHDVRLNGAVLTTIIDVILIAGFFLVSYAFVFLITTKPIFLWSAINAAVIEPLLWLMKYRVSGKHLRLENEQLEIITQLHAEEVASRLKALK